MMSVPEGFGRRNFEDLVNLGACLKHWYPYKKLGVLARGFMRDLKVSPLIYWSTMRRAVRPLIEAETRTLEALGLQLRGPDQDQRPTSCHELAEMVVDVLAAEDNSPLELANQILRSINEEGG